MAMHYYSVAPRSAQYHGKEGLTYFSELILAPGAIVLVPLGKIKVFGIGIAWTYHA